MTAFGDEADGSLGAEYQPDVVLLALAENYKATAGRALQLSLIELQIGRLDWLIVQVKSLPLNTTSGVGLRASQPACHQ